MQHKRVVEIVVTPEQGIEAAKFLAGLALEDQDALGDSATLTAQEIVRDAVTGEIVAVVALVNEEEESAGLHREERILLGAA